MEGGEGREGGSRRKAVSERASKPAAVWTKKRASFKQRGCENLRKQAPEWARNNFGSFTHFIEISLLLGHFITLKYSNIFNSDSFKPDATVLLRNPNVFPNFLFIC